MSWFDSAGRDSDVILGSSVTLIRNIEGFPFCGRDSESDDKLIKKLSEALSDSGLSAMELSTIGRPALGVFAAKRLIGRDIPAKSMGSLMLDEERGVSIALGIRDHVRIRVTGAGESLDECLERAFGFEKLLDDRFGLAYSEDLGYLTSDPAFLGSAASFSVITHLPAVGAARVNRFLTVESLGGDLFEITSPPCPWISEKDQISRLAAAKALIESERAERGKLRNDSTRLCDRIMRAKGIFSNAYLMPLEEFLSLWSDLRLGAVLGIGELLSPEELGGILISAMPACLPPESDEEVARAAMLRRKLERRGLRRQVPELI